MVKTILPSLLLFSHHIQHNLAPLTNVHYRPCLERLLRITGSTLTHLQLVAINRNIQDTFYTIFSTCPQLKRLQYQSISPVRNLSTSETSEAESKLTTHDGATKAIQQLEDLELSLPPIEFNVLKVYLVLFRGLKHLFLTRYPEDEDILDWIDAIFPLLQTIWINDAPHPHFPTRFIHGYTTTTTEERSREYKSLSYNSRYITQESVERFLNKYKSRPMIAFQCKMNPGSDDAREFKWMKNYLHCLATMTEHLRSLVIENTHFVQLGINGQEDEEEEDDVLFDLDLLLYHFPCLEHLALERVVIADITSAVMTNNTNAVTSLSLSHSRPNNNNSTSWHRRTLKTFSVVNCDGFTTGMLKSIISKRFQPHMKYIRIIGSNFSMDQVMNALSKHVQALDQFEVHHAYSDSATIRMIVDSWIGKRLNSLSINGTNRIISPRGLYSYARQKLKYTFVQINSG
ncbi:hypothetical protein BDA99DRAFT_335546 [Phascolomyces articulosus]|uniref:Uncharacterized protein n=1 Tax=Phascolomyces articulosus TaxID=60185 RepID=A0AAD5KDQ1_9FUNG|nr:hypothetical protein BDA99DRAFT_335546 [Phascolomyces articulosus]